VPRAQTVTFADQDLSSAEAHDDAGRLGSKPYRQVLALLEGERG